MNNELICEYRKIVEILDSDDRVQPLSGAEVERLEQRRQEIIRELWGQEVQDLSIYTMKSLRSGLVYPKEDYIPVKIKVAEYNKENKNRSVLKNDEF